MLYLINTPFEQSFSIPRSDRDVVSGEYTLILVDELDSVEHSAEITDVSVGNQYYTMSAKFPRGLHRGEFMYILRKGLAEVARGLVFVGDASFSTPILPQEDVEVFMYMQDVEVIQAQHEVEYFEYDVEPNNELSVMPEYIWLTPGNDFSEDVFVFASVEWNVS